MVERVVATPEAAAVIERLKAAHGPLMFHQRSHGTKSRQSCRGFHQICSIMPTGSVLSKLNNR